MKALSVLKKRIQYVYETNKFKFMVAGSLDIVILMLILLYLLK
jgi:hypothetical protein